MPDNPEPTARKSVTLPKGMWEAIGEYRFSNRIAAEAEAIRQLIQRGLAFPRYQTTIEILAGRVKHYPGPLSAASQPANMMDTLASELMKVEPSLSLDEAAKEAEQIYMKATSEAGADEDRTRALLNVDWQRFSRHQDNFSRD